MIILVAPSSFIARLKIRQIMRVDNDSRERVDETEAVALGRRSIRTFGLKNGNGALRREIELEKRERCYRFLRDSLPAKSSSR